MPTAYAPLPFAFAHLGWPAGIIFLGLAGIVTWYTSLLLASLDRHDGYRHVRYCDLAGSIYGACLARTEEAPVGLPEICSGRATQKAHAISACPHSRLGFALTLRLRCHQETISLMSTWVRSEVCS